MAGLYRSSRIVRRKCRKCNKHLHVLRTKRFCGLCRTPFEINRRNANERRNNGQTDKSPNSSGSICLQLLNNNISKLVCRHRFHNGCIEEWYRIRNNCPVCPTIQPSVSVSQQMATQELLLGDFLIDLGTLRTTFAHQAMEVTIAIDSDSVNLSLG